MKNMKKIMAMTGLCFMVCFALALFTVDSYAQDNDNRPTEKFNPDTGQMEKIQYDEEPGLKAWQIGLGVGSIPVALIVLKYL